MKKAKIIVPAMGLLLLGTAGSITGTVAWFSMNNSVNIDGMKVTTKVQGNLLIASSNSADSNYSTNNYNQPVTGILEPVSTVDGETFFYTKDNVSGTGATSDGSLEAYTNDTALATYYGIANAKAYVDYTFYLKATSDADSQKVVISKANLLYDGGVLGDAKAWRAAVFSKEVAEENTSTDAMVLKSTLGPTGAAYFEATDKAYNTATTKATVDSFGDEAIIGTIATAGHTQRYRVIVRLYLEGEDSSCNNDTYAPLTSDFALYLECKLGANGAQNISSLPAAVASVDGGNNKKADVAQGSLGETLNTYQWQALNNEGAWEDIPSATTSSYTNTANAAKVVRCAVTTASGSYVSNRVSLAAAA